MEKIKEVIVVEGKDDTKRIKRAVNADTIETRGSAIDDPTLALIKKASQKRGIIIFTDPDFSGERIRRIVSEAVPNAKHAFVDRKKSVPTKSDGSLGVEHASVSTIKKALKNVYTSDLENHVDAISRDDLEGARLINDDQAKIRRTKFCNILQIGYVNGKQLPKRLAMFSISKEQFLNAVKELN